MEFIESVAVFVSYCRSYSSAVPTQRSRWPPSHFVLLIFAFLAPLRAVPSILIFACSIRVHLTIVVFVLTTCLPPFSWSHVLQIPNSRGHRQRHQRLEAFQFQLSACFLPCLYGSSDVVHGLVSILYILSETPAHTSIIYKSSCGCMTTNT